MKVKRVCVYCAASKVCDEQHFANGRKLGESLAKLNITVVYGGAHYGVMGAVADGALQASGKVIGYIPSFMQTEAQHPGLTELNIVESMHSRKYNMIMNSDCIIALPGGTGTLDELIEAISWKRLGLIDLPIFILNINGFYDPLLTMFNNMFEERFAEPDLRNAWIVVNTIDEILEKIQAIK